MTENWRKTERVLTEAAAILRKHGEWNGACAITSLVLDRKAHKSIKCPRCAGAGYVQPYTRSAKVKT